MILNKLRKIKLYAITFEGLFFSLISKAYNPKFKCTRKTLRCCENRKSPSYKYHNIGRNIPQCCASHLVEILSDIVMLLDNHNIQYFISFGTLLGAVRHKGIIPWDTDIDIIIAKKDQGKIYNVLLNELNNRSYSVKIDPDENIAGEELIRVFLSETNSIHVDLFPYIENAEQITFYKNKVFKIEDIFPLSQIRFYDLMLSAPKDIGHHLATLYGSDYMTHAYKQWAASTKKFKIKSFCAAKIVK
jgi:hypothetical protein